MFVEPKRLGCSLQRSDMCWFVLLGHRRNVSTERTFNPYGLVFERFYKHSTHYGVASGVV